MTLPYPRLYQIFSYLLVVSLALVPGLSAQAASDSLWVGNMFPQGTNDLHELDDFGVYVEVYRPDVTKQPGQAPSIRCQLNWSQVRDFGQEWRRQILTPMTYVGDSGENDLYFAQLSPGVGRYEYTATCTDELDGSITSQSSGNGRLTTYRVRSAYWINHQQIAWNFYGADAYELHYSPSAALQVPKQRGEGIPLEVVGRVPFADDLPDPRIVGYRLLQLPDDIAVKDILKQEIAIAAYDRNGYLVQKSRLQIQGVLDDLYTYDGPLGVTYEDRTPTLQVWAPTAQSVTLLRFKSTDLKGSPIRTPMQWDPTTGVWSVIGDPSWDRQYYLYEVNVFVPDTREVESNQVTDPYSVNLTVNSKRSQLLDLDQDPTLKPPGWDTLQKPELNAFEDSSIYEVHVRDFSLRDSRVDRPARGTFKAFTYDGQEGRPLSHSMAHLLELANAGLTHVHLMPAFDIVTVEEDEEYQVNPDPDILATFDRNSTYQQALVSKSRKVDGFNWGYDPYHYGVPEGSYSTDPGSTSRILEFRQMVQSLSNHGLRVVMDTVYNHTFAAGQYSDSVLDRIVPGYYYRYDQGGNLQQSSCCPDTATETYMMRKLMIDTLVRWATAYKVDGFRFDLMNLHRVEDMEAVRDALQSLTVANDGVDGTTLYLYGEGWDFGSAKAKGWRHADQFNMAGTGIGTFNDRIRDTIHGGTGAKRRQGFINGQAYDWNGYDDRSFSTCSELNPHRTVDDLYFTMDKLRVGLAGSLRSFPLLTRTGDRIRGFDLRDYGFGGHIGYTEDPQESINYITKHDNETLFDLNIYKLPRGRQGMAMTSMADRVRVQNLGMSLIGLSQGIPFFHMGVDLLRSKSLDRNSYNAGDWFNQVDFTANTNNFGVGLPPASENKACWAVMGPLLKDESLRPTPEDIQFSRAHLLDILRIRSQSKLFRLETAADIEERVTFHNTGRTQKNALIVMSLNDDLDDLEADLDPEYDRILVFFNANKHTQVMTHSAWQNQSWQLHPVQQNALDPVVRTAQFDASTGSFSIPSRTAAVFVLPQTSGS